MGVGSNILNIKWNGPDRISIHIPNIPGADWSRFSGKGKDYCNGKEMEGFDNGDWVSRFDCGDNESRVDNTDAQSWDGLGLSSDDGIGCGFE